jgi:hypothetical protein
MCIKSSGKRGNLVTVLWLLLISTNYCIRNESLKTPAHRHAWDLQTRLHDGDHDHHHFQYCHFTTVEYDAAALHHHAMSLRLAWQWLTVWPRAREKNPIRLTHLPGRRDQEYSHPPLQRISTSSSGFTHMALLSPTPTSCDVWQFTGDKNNCRRHHSGPT